MIDKVLPHPLDCGANFILLVYHEKAVRGGGPYRSKMEKVVVEDQDLMPAGGADLGISLEKAGFKLQVQFSHAFKVTRCGALGRILVREGHMAPAKLN